MKIEEHNDSSIRLGTSGFIQIPGELLEENHINIMCEFNLFCDNFEPKNELIPKNVCINKIPALVKLQDFQRQQQSKAKLQHQSELQRLAIQQQLGIQQYLPVVYTQAAPRPDASGFLRRNAN